MHAIQFTLFSPQFGVHLAIHIHMMSPPLKRI
uniref:Uncharacterized protein n=1 Tax=Vitis vinifera TaxID=29760 RepID=F6HMS4_VITVI